MGERRKEAFRVGFDRAVKIEFRGAHVAGDAGLLAFRGLDGAPGLSESAAEFPTDTRTGRNTRHARAAPLGQSVYSRPAGYKDTNDAGQLGNEAMRCLVGGGAEDPTANSSRPASHRMAPGPPVAGAPPLPRRGQPDQRRNSRPFRVRGLQGWRKPGL